ncbi:MAG TPA: hypothetical protein VLG38_02315 [Gammaproteobacteria bacterium]|nr:hypothetical protein [Gammaproteobacteria bacterium]
MPSIKLIEELSGVLTAAGILNFQIHTKNKNEFKDLDTFLKITTGGCIALACGQLRVGYSDHYLDTAIYLRGGKSAIDVTQVAGRVMRYDETTNPQKIGFLITFADAITTEFDAATKPEAAATPVPLHAFTLHAKRNGSSPDSIDSSSSSSASAMMRSDGYSEIKRARTTRLNAL